MTFINERVKKKERRYLEFDERHFCFVACASKEVIVPLGPNRVASGYLEA